MSNLSNIILLSDSVNDRYETIVGLTCLNISNNIVNLYPVDMSIMLVSDDMNTKYIDEIGKQSDLSILCIKQPYDTGRFKHVDMVIPYSSDESIYWVIRAIVESITSTKNIIGVDLTDINYIAKGAGYSESVVVNSINELSNIQNCKGALVTVFGHSPDIKLLKDIYSVIQKQTNPDVTIIQSMIIDKGMDEGSIKIVVVFTGLDTD